jgi:predicted HTH transcriptional regulator
MRNPGRMLVSIEDFYAGSHSMCRNPLIQKMFMLLGYGERAGSGADIIVKGWQKYNWERPEIEESIQPEETMLLMPMNVGIRRVSSLKDSLGVPSNVPSLSQVVTKLYQLVPSMTDLQYEKALNVILALTEGDLSMQSLMSHVGVSNRSRFRKDVIAPLIQIGFISRTPRGRIAMPDAYNHLGYYYQEHL